MSYELKWMIYTVLFTSLAWMPYVLNRIKVRGLLPAMGYTDGEPAPHSPWAERTMKAHTNAVENLVLFAPVVLAVHVLGISTEATRMAVVTFFAMRVLHYVCYSLAIPYLRTLSFTIGWISILALAFAALGAA